MTLDEFGHEPDIVGAQRAAAAIRGSTDALREVWQQHRRWIAGVLLAHKPRDVDLEDLLQDVALSLVKRIGDLRDPAAVRPWLRQVAINAARASGRREQVRRPERRGLRIDAGDAASTLASGTGPTAARSLVGSINSEGREEGAHLLGLARGLPEGYAEPLILRCVRGMSYREIGRVLDLPETTVETRIARARRMVREMVALQAAGAPQRATSAIEAAPSSTADPQSRRDRRVASEPSKAPKRTGGEP